MVRGNLYVWFLIFFLTRTFLICIFVAHLVLIRPKKIILPLLIYFLICFSFISYLFIKN